ncbi:hypothetical protein GOBAR_DD33975 [Gossypium barbadense]|nr:hypothetical protein GOBAR_DD33975 [Gossypium barbadense]
MCNFDIDLNIRYLDQYSGGATSTWPQNSHHVVLQIHLIVIETDAHDEDGFNNNFGFNHGDEDFNGPDVNDILNDIENEGADDENYYTPLVRNSSHGIVIRNDLGSYMPIVNPDAKQASKFLSTLDIIPAHMMLADSKPEELFIVPSPTFDLVQNFGLHRKPRGRPHVTQIRNDMDMKERVDPKCCGVRAWALVGEEEVDDKVVFVGDLVGAYVEGLPLIRHHIGRATHSSCTIASSPLRE